MDGGREVYDGFYLYARAVGGLLPAGPLGPARLAWSRWPRRVPLSPRSGDSVVRWAYVAAGTATFAAVLGAARTRVRAYAAEVRALALRDQLTGV